MNPEEEEEYKTKQEVEGRQCKTANMTLDNSKTKQVRPEPARETVSHGRRQVNPLMKETEQNLTADPAEPIRTTRQAEQNQDQTILRESVLDICTPPMFLFLSYG